MKSLSSVLALVPFALASPSLLKRVDTSEVCGQYDTVTAGNYELLTDLWGESDATSGSQCSQITSQSGSDIAWTTTWTWTGGSSVKSFSNIQLNEGINVQLSTISSMPVRTLAFVPRSEADESVLLCALDETDDLGLVVRLLGHDRRRRRVRHVHERDFGRLRCV